MGFVCPGKIREEEKGIVTNSTAGEKKGFPFGPSLPCPRALTAAACDLQPTRARNVAETERRYERAGGGGHKHEDEGGPAL